MSIAALESRLDSAETLFIGGRWRSGGHALERFDPSDLSRSTGRYAAASSDDVARAYAAAAAAQPAWAAKTALERGEILRATADHLASELDAAARRLTSDIGKVIRDARGEVMAAIQTLRYYATEVLQPAGEIYPSADPSTTLFTLEQPLGVVCAITPWNFPFAIPAFKLAPAVAFGNTAVWKPAEAASGSAVFLTEAFAEAGLPDGVLNLVTGKGAALSEPLTSDPHLAALTFTGSNAVGSRLRQAVADRNVKVQLELGGKNAAIVLADADLDDAATRITRAAMFATGQRCTATSRVYVERAVADEFIERLRDAVGRLVVGDPFDDATDVGPSAFAEQRDKVAEYLDLARDEGAEVLAGGPPDGEGCFVKPTILSGVDPDSRIVREEIFGPVLVVEPVEDFDSAIASANDTEYGLSSAVFTRDVGKALAFARRTESGVVAINRETAGIEPHVPFGGVKASSSMSRELGKAARQFFTTTKTVYLRSSA
jgi:acyl-CoA reductase-like NAD-dependent aldehyde dehydrogenase